MNKVNVAFIGAGGFVSAHHLLTARDSAAMNVRAIADVNERVLQRHAARMPVEYTTTDYLRVLADPAVDLVVIGTKQDTHAQLIVEGLDAGKWVYCEKPMAETRPQSAAVLAAEARNPGRLAVGFNRRFAPAITETRRLLRQTPRPWYVNYRLMMPSIFKEEESRKYYAACERILYEGTHVLDLVCWLLEDKPQRVFMSGDRLHNNCCILEFADGSRVSFTCGSLGSPCATKEHIEVFTAYTAIIIDEFIDMRVRGFKGEYDRVFAPHLDEHADAVRRYGMDFFETYKVEQMLRDEALIEACDRMGAQLERVRRPGAQHFDAAQYAPVHPDLWSFIPDKGWVQALEHFASCCRDGKVPMNADARAGALTTDLALALLRSLDRGEPVDFTGAPPDLRPDSIAAQPSAT